MKKLILSSISLFIVLVCHVASAFETRGANAVIMDYDSGTVLYQKNADDKIVPSAMTQLMTSYIVFERLKKGVMKLDDEFNVSENAWRADGSKMLLRVKDHPTIDELLRGIIVESGSDASITVAEGIAADEDIFAKLMNKTAEKIGLQNSHFTNSTGLPDDGQYVTARDLALLAKDIIIQFPDYYHYFSEAEYSYNDIKQKNNNLLLERNIGVDGLKVGHTEDGGYAMVVSAVRGGKRLIVVLSGLSNELENADEAAELLNYGFDNFEQKVLFKAGQVVDSAEVWQGQSDSVELAIKDDINLIVPKSSENEIKIDISYDGPIAVPVQKCQEIAKLTITIPDMDRSYTYPLVAAYDVEVAGLFDRIISNIKLYWNTP